MNINFIFSSKKKFIWENIITKNEGKWKKEEETKKRKCYLIFFFFEGK